MHYFLKCSFFLILKTIIITTGYRFYFFYAPKNKIFRFEKILEIMIQFTHCKNFKDDVWKLLSIF